MSDIEKLRQEIADLRREVRTIADTPYRSSKHKSLIDLNTAHRTSNGADHSYIDQDVTETADVTHDTLTLTGASLLAGDVALNISDGNIKVASGHGIDFSAHGNAAGMTSELLDDYEEGTWTPIILGETTPGTYTYTTNIGIYRKIGDVCTLWGAIKLSGVSVAGTGGVLIGGLPFTSNATLGGISALMTSNLAADRRTVFTINKASTTNLYVIYANTTGAVAGMSTTDLSGDEDFTFTVSYIVN